MSRPLLVVSASEEATERLLDGGPRRDFIELARRIQGEVAYRPSGTAGRRWWHRFVGPHVGQAWQAAANAEHGQLIFADGEHVGVPLAAFLWLRRKRCSLTMLAHLPGRPWKRALFWAVSRLYRSGTVVLHSREQFDALQGVLADSWTCRLVPYQVDTDFWTANEMAPGKKPLFVAAGAENRDYSTLIAAARRMCPDARFVIAAGSHWARKEAAASDVPINVELLQEAMPFSELRALYERATAVVVPLQDVANQSGITTILEAMSMGRPVIVTATRGQRECITGPLVRESGPDWEATAGRGPHQFDPAWPAEPTGLYVEVGDVAGLTEAMRMLTEDPDLARRMGAEGRRAAQRYFRTDQYIDRLEASLAEMQPGERPMAAIAQ